jgi:hypothetical protein
MDAMVYEAGRERNNSGKWKDDGRLFPSHLPFALYLLKSHL